MFASRVTALPQPPAPPRAQSHMRVFEHAVIAKEIVEAQPFVKSLAPPYSATRCDEIHFAHAAERRLQIDVDGITAAVIVAARFIGRKKLQSQIPAPSFVRLRVYALIGAITQDAADFARRVLLESSDDVREEIRFEPDVIIHQRDEIAARRVNADVALNRRPAAVPNVATGKRQR